MFKTIITLLRSQAHDANEHFTDKNAMAILRQQIRDCSHDITAARKSIALSSAQHEQDQTAYQELLDKIQDLETRTISALENDKPDLAQEGAEMIASLEAERDSAKIAIDSFSNELKRLKCTLKSNEQRLLALKRGERLAATNKATQDSVQTANGTSTCTLREAEETLARLKTRQLETTRSQEILAEYENSSDSKAIIEKLANAGCGEALQASASNVLVRLNTTRTNTLPTTA
jgi:phage shock protein A